MNTNVNATVQRKCVFNPITRRCEGLGCVRVAIVSTRTAARAGTVAKQTSRMRTHTLPVSMETRHIQPWPLECICVSAVSCWGAAIVWSGRGVFGGRLCQTHTQTHAYAHIKALRNITISSAGVFSGGMVGWEAKEGLPGILYARQSERTAPGRYKWCIYAHHHIGQVWRRLLRTSAMVSKQITSSEWRISVVGGRGLSGPVGWGA